MKSHNLLRLFLWLIFCCFPLAALGQQAKVKCANSVAEYQQRTEEQRKEVESLRKAVEQAEHSYMLNGEVIRRLIQDELNGRIIRHELEVEPKVAIYGKNPDYLELQVDARKIPVSIPDGVAEIIVEFTVNNNSSQVTYSLPVCSGKDNHGYRLKPKNVSRLTLTSFKATSYTYTVPNLNALMSVENGPDKDVLAGASKEQGREQASKKEEEERLRKVSEDLADPTVLEPDCQVDKFLSDTELVQAADAIVLARPKSVDSRTRKSDPTEQLINFEVKRVLKGNSLPKDLLIAGVLTKSNDHFRTQQDCIPNNYAKDNYYLLFLKESDGKFILYWYPKAPINERVSGENDAWVQKVLSELRPTANTTPGSRKSKQHS